MAAVTAVSACALFTAPTFCTSAAATVAPPVMAMSAVDTKALAFDKATSTREERPKLFTRITTPEAPPACVKVSPWLMGAPATVTVCCDWKAPFIVNVVLVWKVPAFVYSATSSRVLLPKSVTLRIVPTPLPSVMAMPTVGVFKKLAVVAVRVA